MTVTRGDVVLVDFPTGPGQPPKRRPAIVVQSDHNNRRLTTSIFAMVTSNIRLANVEPTQVLIDVGTAEGKQCGLRRNSAVKCENLFTLPVAAVRKIGTLPTNLLEQVQAALKASLSLT